MSEIMLSLANNYRLGIGVISAVLIILYLVVSILAIRKYRTVYGDFSVACMIPVVGFILFLIAVLKDKKSKPNSQGTNDEIVEDIF